MRNARIAVEGCGHGTLKAIYASVEKSCEAKGWPNVDLLIIGGDFQVRIVLLMSMLPTNPHRQSATLSTSTAWPSL
jgi:hypothetical protein